MTIATLLCTLCGGGLRPSGGTRARFGLLECAVCGRVLSRRAIVPGAGEDIQQRHFGDAFADADDWWTRAVDRANARRVWRVLAPYLAPGARILEIGPGRGAALLARVAGRCRAQGLELSPAAARRAAARSGAPVALGTLERHGHDSAVYDAIVGRRVFEHGQEPVATLASFRRLLGAGGIVYPVVVPIGAPEAALSEWTGYHPYHLHYFTPGTLAGLFQRHGFAVLVCRTREPFSGWTNAVVNSLRGAPDGAASAAPSRPLLRLAYDTARIGVEAVTWPGRLVQQWSGHGEEIELVARRMSP